MQYRKSLLGLIDDFPGDPLPAGSVAEYSEYMKRSIDFIRARNARIDGYAIALDGST